MPRISTKNKPGQRPHPHLERSVPARFRSSKALSNRRFSVLLTPNAMHVATSCLHSLFTSSGGPEIGIALLISPQSLEDKTLAVQATFPKRQCKQVVLSL